MFRRPTTQNPSNGRARKVATALLLAAMFLVPMTPMGDATLTSSSFGVATVSGSDSLSSSAHYNFTFKTTGGNDRAFRVDFPSGWTSNGGSASGATAGDNNFGGISSGASATSSGAGFFNFTATSDFATGSTVNYINVTGINPPRVAGTYTLTASLFNSTGALNGTEESTVTVSAVTLGIDLDSDNTANMVLGSGAVTDYYIEVTKRSGYVDTDSINLTFPSGFDLSSASLTNGDISGRNVGYNIQSGDLGTSTFLIHINDVENPIVSANTEFTVSAKILDSNGKTVGTGDFDIDIIPTDIEVDHATSSSTILEEGKTNDDSIEVSLNSKPGASVTITIDGGSQVTPDDDELVFTTANWGTAQVVKLTAVDDSAVEGTMTQVMTFTAESTDDNFDKIDTTFSVQILDNDQGIVLRQLDADGDEDDETIVEEGDTTGDRYEVYLSTQPDDTVTITIDPHSNLNVDDTELTFTKSKWDDPQEIKVTSARTDDDDYQDDIDYTILHTAESDDTDYDEEEAELTVTLVDDEHPALGLTEEQIRDANELVELELEETDDGITLTWTLPEQEDLDEIFDSDGEIEIQGIQILYSNSPYTIAETFEDSDDEFEDAEWLHDFDDDASVRTKYLVTMYYQEDVGKWDADNVPDTRDDGYSGLALQDPLLPWWGWLIIGVVGVVIIALILAAVVASQNRRAYGAAEWNDEDEESEAPVQATAPVEESSDKQKARKYDLECPVCDHHFTAKGAKPLKTECPNCGAKGVLN